MIPTTLVRSGLGRKDSNSALADEFFSTLEATHGNSAQAKSLLAMLNRAESRLAAKAARKDAKATAKATPAAKAPKAAKATAKATEPTPKAKAPAKRESNAQKREARQAAIAADNAAAER